MSCNYAEGLSPYENKGRLGAPEKFDSPKEVEEKVSLLAEWVKEAKHIVVHTGAGISTSAGIPDFRGPKGVWTLEKKGLKPDMNVSWDDAKPTYTHMALSRLVEVGKVKFVITQNIDGLHLRSGIPRTHISELHGNMFVDQCDKCKKMFVRDSPAPTVGLKVSSVDCPAYRPDGRKCRGHLRDFVLDWEDSLPDDDLTISESHSMMADLSIVMGSTLQIIPAGNMPTYTKKYQGNGKLVICNLQPTKHAKKADLNIHTYIDDVMKLLMQKLDLSIRDYTATEDPVQRVKRGDIPELGYLDWTQCSMTAKEMKKAGDELHETFLRVKREEKKRKYVDTVRQNKLRKREEGEEDEKEEKEEEKNDVEDVEDGDTKDNHSDHKPDTKLPSDNLRTNGVKTELCIKPEPSDRPATNGFKVEETVKTENGSDGINHENGANRVDNVDLSALKPKSAEAVDVCGRPPLDETAV